ncbi:hypothetical protein BBJ28_00015777 [Nothophytophthora sp. Chile5]|nr:hypothetical protein BBJ28_00015777 [Nothophytophthora sp. Chile5]
MDEQLLSPEGRKDMLSPFATAPAGYDARRRRSEWPVSVRTDPEVQALDEQSGEWILCRTCAEHFERTRRGRKPNDPSGFKVKMNGKFQEAAWVMHKNRVVAHRTADGLISEASEEEEEDDQDLDLTVNGEEILSDSHQGGAKRRKTASSSGGEDQRDDPVAVSMTDGGYASQQQSVQIMNLPTTGWRCPGIVPDTFYQTHTELVHAFAKYYVGTYRVNVVRDLRSDKYVVNGMHNSLMGWRISAEELAILSKFKHSSDSNLNVEGRTLKQAAMAAFQHFSGPTKSSVARKSANNRQDRAQQPLPMEKQDELQADGVEIVVQPNAGRRSKLSLPDLSSIQIRSPIGPMKSSIRSALKELRSRQMVQSLCSKFEARMKGSTVDEDDEVAAPAKKQSTKSRRQAATVAPVKLESDPTRQSDSNSTATVRSNNLNKFLRSYASNLDNAVFAQPSIKPIAAPEPSKETEDDEFVLVLPTRKPIEESVARGTERFADSLKPSLNFGKQPLPPLTLALRPIELGPESSNQCDSPKTAESVALLIEATDCDQLEDERLECEEGNNNAGVANAPELSRAFTTLDFATEREPKQAAPEKTRGEDSKPESGLVRPAKVALARFQEQIPANGRKLTTL